MLGELKALIARQTKRPDTPTFLNPAMSARIAASSGVGCGVGSLRAMVLLFCDTRALAAQAAQVIELGAAHFAAAHDLDGIDHRRIQRKHALHAFAIGDLADREVLLQAGTGA